MPSSFTESLGILSVKLVNSTARSPRSSRHQVVLVATSSGFVFLGWVPTSSEEPCVSTAEGLAFSPLNGPLAGRKQTKSSPNPPLLEDDLAAFVRDLCEGKIAFI